MFKRGVLIALIGVISISGLPSIYANSVSIMNESGIVVPCMEYINNATVALKITTSGEAQVRSSIVGYASSVDKVKIEATLQRYSNNTWSNLKTWTKTYNDYKGNMGETYQVSKGSTYRVVTKFTAYSGSKFETQTVIGSEIKY